MCRIHLAIASLMEFQARLIEAKKYAYHAINISETSGVIDYSIIAEAKYIMHSCLIKEGDKKAALDVLESSIEKDLKNLEPNHPSSLKTLKAKIELSRK